MMSSSAGQPAALPRTSATASAKDAQCPAAAAGGDESVDGPDGIVGVAQLIEQPAGGRRAGARHELDDAKARHPVARVRGPAQEGEDVLDMSGLEELQPAELHERDVAARELDLERGAVVRGPKQHGLRLERMPPSRCSRTFAAT